MVTENFRFYSKSFSENSKFSTGFIFGQKIYFEELEKTVVFRRSHVANDPINKIDPTGLYECTYSISSHSMKCTPNNSNNPTYSNASFVSGNGPGKNNASAADVPFEGPIPPGDYNVGPQNPGSARRNLTPINGTNTMGRNGFQTHGCSNESTCSEGCIAATTNSNRMLLNYIFGLEEGNNVIHVVP